MVAGAWVFPIAIASFLVFFAGYLVANPAEPASAGAALRLVKTQPGDRVLFEVTEYFNATHAYVSYTTREDVYSSGRFNASPWGTGFDARPIEIQIPADARPDDGTVFSHLLGHRVNDTFTTPHIANLYGAWQETRTIGTTVAVLDAVVTVRGGDATPEGQFNYTRFVQGWGQALQRPVREGDLLRCEGRSPWPCQILKLDATNQSITYRRLIDDGDVVPASSFLAFAQGTPVPSINATLRAAGDASFEVRLLLRPGDAFSLAQPAGDWQRGAYRVEAAGGDQATARYAPLGQRAAPAHLIGETVWYEFTPVDVARA